MTKEESRIYISGNNVDDILVFKPTFEGIDSAVYPATRSVVI